MAEHPTTGPDASITEGTAPREVTASADPLATLAEWVEEAALAGAPSPRTLTFATVGPDGAPHARTVLSTLIDSEHVRFHSSAPTTKTRDLLGDPRASAVFFWPEIGRQVILHGSAVELDEATSRAAYPTRPRQLQLVAWAYDDVLTGAGDGAIDPEVVSADVPTSATLVAERVAHHAARPAEGLPMPASWTTIEFTPTRVDLWQGVGRDVAALKTRYDKGADGVWTHAEILP
ncbi:Pyridoxamine 5'-phosphate oxidase [Sanguibacter gelidistatuariae]|uniref:Pyridoxamine 5'-phosphate oxidase n=1 Tax=Sanguibacter gelidistatuariae TaxID=1814289 RepID=A0A1G6GRU3_9MICO|nr:pyridoxamine 5'-phosphate oxidase family protein [Sanguibacter gelidistatuariae]SDB84573.1 Pyridoxamine 5'-phosphate oxidase [Sanguibacter gelidistatuariae]